MLTIIKFFANGFYPFIASGKTSDMTNKSGLQKFCSRFLERFLIAFGLFTSVNSYGQTTEIVRKAPIPKEFISPAKGRFEEEKKGLNTKEKSKILKAKTEFYLQSNYQLDFLLKSGKVVFNDAVSTYLEKVTAILLKDNPNLKDKIKIYPILFDHANAFTFNEGYIFVNIGLIARLENEAELAFILAHEITHYTKQHSIKKVIKSQQIQKSSAQEQEAIFKISRYSRENEFESDMGGLDMMMKTPYNKMASISALEMLYISDQPYNNIPFNKGFLESGTLVIPNQFVWVKPIETEEEANSEQAEEERMLQDSLSTHPGIEKRVRVLKNVLAKKDNKGENFLVSDSAEFIQIRNLCRFEMAKLFAANEEYVPGLYHNFLMQNEYPENTILARNKAILMGKLCIAQYYNSYRQLVSGSANEDEGKSYRELIDEETGLRELLLKLSKEEFHLVALKNCLIMSRRFSEDKYLKELSDKLISTYKERYNRSLMEFETMESFSVQKIDEMYSSTKQESAPKDKGGRILKAKKKKKKYVFESSFAKYALSDLIANDTQFVNAYNGYSISDKAMARKAESSEDEDVATTEEVEEIYGRKSKNKKEKAKEPGALGANKIILLEPQYAKTDYRKGVKRDFIGDEQTERELIRIIKTAANQTGMDIALLAPNEMKENDIEKFNDYAILKAW